MSDVPVSLGTWYAQIGGLPPSVYAGGQTVIAPVSGTYGRAFQAGARALIGYPMTRALTTFQLAKNIPTAVGVVPGGVTVVGFIVLSDDLDSGGSALRQSLFVGSTEVVTALAVGSTGTSILVASLPTRTTAETPIYISTTTLATTAAAGSVTVIPIYVASET